MCSAYKDKGKNLKGERRRMEVMVIFMDDKFWWLRFC